MSEHSYLKEFTNIKRDRKNEYNRDYYFYNDAARKLRCERHARWYAKKYKEPIFCEICSCNIVKMHDHCKSKKHLNNEILFNLKKETEDQKLELEMVKEESLLQCSKLLLEKNELEISLDKLIVKPYILPIKKSKYGVF